MEGMLDFLVWRYVDVSDDGKIYGRGMSCSYCLVRR